MVTNDLVDGSGPTIAQLLADPNVPISSIYALEKACGVSWEILASIQHGDYGNSHATTIARAFEALGHTVRITVEGGK